MGSNPGLKSMLAHGVDRSLSDPNRARRSRHRVRKWRGGAIAALFAASLIGPTVAQADAPSAAITSAPPATTTSTSATIAFKSASSTATFRCRLDSSAWNACKSPTSYSGLAVGSHTFSVYAVSTAGVAGPTVSASWTVSAPALTPAPAPAPTSSATSGTSGTVLWNGDLSTGNLSQWWVQTPNGGQITAVSNPHPDPNFSGSYAAQFGVDDLNVNGQAHPAATLISGNYKLYPGNDFYLGFSVYLPSNFPQHLCYANNGAWITACWMQLMEIYGAPYGGPAPISLNVLGGNGAGHANQFVWNGPYHGISSTYNGAAWRSPQFSTSPTGWQSFVWHVHLSQCGGTTACTGGQLPGFVELWMNGVQQHFFDGSTRVYFATLGRSNWCTAGMGTNCGWDAVYMQQYRGQYPYYTTGYTGGSSTYSPTYPSNGLITDYLADMKLGTSYAAAAPH